MRCEVADGSEICAEPPNQFEADGPVTVLGLAPRFPELDSLIPDHLDEWLQRRRDAISDHAAVKVVGR
jgi:hypothetical protein